MCLKKSNKQKKKNLLFFGVLTVTEEKEQDPDPSGSVSQMYGYADPDPYQNVTDPEHCK
jgi:hypothetical protein